MVLFTNFQYCDDVELYLRYEHPKAGEHPTRDPTETSIGTNY